MRINALELIITLAITSITTSCGEAVVGDSFTEKENQPVDTTSLVGLYLESESVVTGSPASFCGWEREFNKTAEIIEQEEALFLHRNPQLGGDFIPLIGDSTVYSGQTETLVSEGEQCEMMVTKSYTLLAIDNGFKVHFTRNGEGMCGAEDCDVDVVYLLKK